MSSKQKDLLIRFDKLEKCSQREAALALKIPQPTKQNFKIS
jgi:hypothetical protein